MQQLRAVKGDVLMIIETVFHATTRLNTSGFAQDVNTLKQSKGKGKVRIHKVL